MNMEAGEPLSIWFFIGISLLVNGILVTGAGIHQLISPPRNPVVLFSVHANVWWGALMGILGAVYCYHFMPKRVSHK